MEINTFQISLIKILDDKKDYFKDKDNSELENYLKIYYNVLVYPISKSNMNFYDFKNKALKILN